MRVSFQCTVEYENHLYVATVWLSGSKVSGRSKHPARSAAIDEAYQKALAEEVSIAQERDSSNIT